MITRNKHFALQAEIKKKTTRSFWEKDNYKRKKEKRKENQNNTTSSFITITASKKNIAVKKKTSNGKTCKVSGTYMSTNQLILKCQSLLFHIIIKRKHHDGEMIFRIFEFCF